MNDLLKLSLEAHGWLERWRRLTVARASAYIIGELWRLKGQPGVLKNIQVESAFAPRNSRPAE